MSGIEKLKAFAKSPHHAWLALVTLGAGLASVSAIGLVAGAAAYALGWVYLPDSGLFRRWLAKREGTREKDELRNFLFRRRQVYDSLGNENRRRYDALARDIEELIDEFKRDVRLKQGLVAQRTTRLTNLGWTYLRLLHSREMLERFLRSEDPGQVEQKIDELTREIEALNPNERIRLVESKRSRLESLKSRLNRHDEAEANLELALAEQERILDLVKLYRADHLASRDAGTLSHEIDRSSPELDRTRDWLRELEFDTSPADIPEELTADAPVRVA